MSNESFEQQKAAVEQHIREKHPEWKLIAGVTDVIAERDRRQAKAVLKQYRPELVEDVGEKVTAVVMDHPGFWSFIAEALEYVEPDDATYTAARYLQQNPGALVEDAFASALAWARNDAPIEEFLPGTPGGFFSDTERKWEPGRWWIVLGPDGERRCETSNEAEARQSMRPGDRLFRNWVYRDEEWREVTPE